MPTAGSNRKIRELVQGLGRGTLIPKPDFQRRLVWSKEDKIRFVETVLKDLPFPEIYLANGEVDTNTGEGTELIVDGQQRTVTLRDYFEGVAPFNEAGLIPTYQQLTEEQRRQFLNYDVALRHLGDASKEQIIEIFKRINATRYALNDMEVNNAIFDGKLKLFSQSIAESGFFEKYRVFRPLQLRRMGDTRYVLGIVITMMAGYFNRDELLSEYLERYNDEFPEEAELRGRITNALAAIDGFEFDEKSRAFKQADLFTLIVEMDKILTLPDRQVQLDDVREALRDFYAQVDHAEIAADDQNDVVEYRRAVLQAANDRSNRRTRGRIIHAVALGAAAQPQLLPADK